MASVTHYASLLVAGEEMFGTAELVCGSGYLFRRDGERQATPGSSRHPELLLLGLVDLSEMQHDVDLLVGGYAAIACGRAN